MLGALVVTIAAVWGGFRLKRTLVDERPYDYGAQMAEVQRLTEQLRKEPCDRHNILALGELMLGAGDGRGTLKALNAFLEKCGDYPRLRRVTLAAHMRLSEWDEATSEATKLIESDPYDVDFRVWRGLVYEQKHDWVHAADDYRQRVF